MGKDERMSVLDEVPKDLKKHFREAEKQGWRFERTRKGGQAFAPDGVHIVTFHLTPGRNATREVLSKMRKYGYQPPRR